MSSAESIDRSMHPLFQAGESGSKPTSALDLVCIPAGVRDAVRLNGMWHSRLPRIPASNVYRNRYHACYAMMHGDPFAGTPYAIAIWTSPVAGPHAFPIESTIELRRLATAPDAPRNTCSRMLRIMIRILRTKFPALTRFISYQDTAVHAGCIYRAAGWVATARTDPGEIHWNNGSRERALIQTAAAKVRWEKVLR